MRYSQLLIPTLKEEPAEAEAASHRLMLRAGYVRQLAAGIYLYLPLGQRVMEKILAILREEMRAIGAQEITMPILHPAEIWRETGRYEAIGPELFRLKDRGDREMVLGMTHEEVIAWLAAREIRSYRELPQVWYQIQTKLRDEARPKSGVLRTREFLMKDSYSLDASEEGLQKNYQAHLEAYRRIFTRCGLRYYVVESDPGMMGGASAHEFMAPSPAGEDDVALCACGYAANVELADSQPPVPDFPRWLKLEEVATPEQRTIDEVTAFLGVDPKVCIKTLLLIGDQGPFLALIRGDQTLHEKKLARLMGPFRPAHREEVAQFAGVEAGFVGPVGLDLPKIADRALQSGVYLTGANKAGWHLQGVVPGHHFEARIADLHVVQPGDGCPACGRSLQIERVIEVGNIFKLGTKYSLSLKAMFLDEQGRQQPIIMGSYGIGPARIAAAAIEQHHDGNGIIWPLTIAPFHAVLLPLNVRVEACRETAERYHRELEAAGVEVLLDDRDERAGVKFKDADLLGIPYQVVFGEKGLKEGVVEIKARRDSSVARVPVDEGVARLREILRPSIPPG